MHFAGASGVLDVFHVIEKVAGAAKGIYAQDAATDWTDAGRDTLLIGRWLKQTGARWTFRRVNRMGLLCCLVYSDHWKSYWTAT